MGQNYFCETGITSGYRTGVLYPNGDPLWDGQGVVSLVPVAPSTHHHGSMYNCLLPQLMTLRSGSVVMKGLEMKILQLMELCEMMVNAVAKLKSVELVAQSIGVTVSTY